VTLPFKVTLVAVMLVAALVVTSGFADVVVQVGL
jgi:hypothetical protein